MIEEPKQEKEISTIEEAEEAMRQAKTEEEWGKAASVAIKLSGDAGLLAQIESQEKFWAEKEKEKVRATGPAEIFPDIDNRSRFEKLSDGAKNFAGGLYERAKIDIVDRAKVMYNDYFFDLHAIKAAGLKSEFEEAKRNIEQLETQKTRHREILEKFQKESAYPLDAKTAKKAEKERIEIERAINTEKAKTDRLQSKLESRNQKKTIYENRRNEICANVIERINERLEPYEKKLENLKAQRGQLNLAIENFKKDKQELSQEAKDLEDMAKKAAFKFERRMYKERAKKVKESLKESDKLIKEKSKAGNKADKNIAKFDGKANPWRDRKAEFTRITKREAANIPVPRRKEEKAEFKRKEVEGTTRIPAEGEVRRETEEEGRRVEAGERRLIKVEDFIEIWNSHFGSKMPLSYERLRRVLEIKYGLDDRLDYEFLAKELKDYYVLARGEGLIDKKKIKEKDFRKYLAIFERIIKRQT